MGKSTLLKLIAGLDSPDQGTLSRTSGLKVSYLEQVPVVPEDLSIYQALVEGVDLEDWEHHAAAHEYISRFELDQFGEEAQVGELSGGWKKRVALARELIKKPDLLLLDEPTNHLDVEGIMWLEKFLANARFATLTVTHDRLFLQRISNQIIELDRRHAGGLLKVEGDYSKYLEVREQVISSQERRETILKNTLRRETEWLRQGAKARTTKQQARIDRAEDLKSEVETLAERNLSRTASLEFKSVGRSPQKLIEAKEVSHAYNGKITFQGLNLKITPKSRIGLLGKNGAGKSTLIRVLLGEEAIQSGEVFRSDQLQVAYFEQTQEQLDPDLTVAETLCPSGTHVDYCGRPMHIMGYLDRFLFSKQQAAMKVEKLSGGERNRLKIAQLMLKPANVLILDEPTNDLDMVTLSVLEECLQEFQGAVILVTHDRYFMDQVVNQLIVFPELMLFEGFAQWEAWHATLQGSSKGKPNPGKESDSVAKKTKTKKPDLKLGFKEQRELDGMEKEIQSAEKRLEELIEQSALPANQSNSTALMELSEKMAETQSQIEKLYKRWAELEERSQ